MIESLNPKISPPAALCEGGGIFGKFQISLAKIYYVHYAIDQENRAVQIASLPRSPVRIRITSSTGNRKIFPSPIFPVLAALSMVSIA